MLYIFNSYILQRQLENNVILPSSPPKKPQEANSLEYSNHPSPKLPHFNSDKIRRNSNPSQNQEIAGI